MGALFYNYSGNDIYKTAVPGGASPFSTDLFDDIVGADNLCILTEIRITNSDTIQLFTSFDDFIHYYFFGKGVGSIAISGMLFADCDQKLPGLDNFYTAIGQNRGQQINVIAGNTWFTGVLLDCTIGVVAEPETMVSFTANLAMIYHGLPSPPVSKGACDGGSGYAGPDGSDNGLGGSA